jgi:CheY-like chemotaxis protein
VGRLAPRILVADDDDDVRVAIAEVVARAGYDVAVARHGGEALDAIADARTRPALVLLDLMMPVVDGWTVIERTRAQAIDVPIIALTAAADPRLPVGIEIVPKPFRGDQLIALIGARCGAAKLPKLEVVAYVADDCAESTAMLETLTAVMDAFEPDHISCVVRNVARTPAVLLAADGIGRAPTLIMHRPLRLRFTGPLRSQHLLRTVLGLVDVPRRRGVWARY